MSGALIDVGPTLLGMVRGVATEIGLPTPNYVINSPDNTARQLGALAQRLGAKLAREYDWTILTREFHVSVPPPTVLTGNLTKGSLVITGLSPAAVTNLLPAQMIVSGTGFMNSTRLVATDNVHGTATVDQPATATLAASQVTFRQDTFKAPDDFLRGINRTAWDRSMHWELRGPQSPQWDQWTRSGIVSTGPRRTFRQFGPFARIWPAPSATDSPAQLITEYVSGYWVVSAAGQPQPGFAADSDACVFDPDLMVSGIKYLFFQIKGFDYGEFKAQFMRSLQGLRAADGGSPTLNMSTSRPHTLMSSANVQDGNFGIP